MVKEADGLCRNKRRHVKTCRNNLRKRKFGSHVTLKFPRIFGGSMANKLEGSREVFHRPDAQQSRTCCGTLSLSQEECVTQQAKDFCSEGTQELSGFRDQAFSFEPMRSAIARREESEEGDNTSTDFTAKMMQRSYRNNQDMQVEQQVFRAPRHAKGH